MLDKKTEEVRNFIFGVQDSLVSTIGLVSGIAVAGVPRTTLILTGIVLIFVEAFSMGVGSLVSENAAEEYAEKTEVPFSKDFLDSLIMFSSYLFSGFLVLLPFLFLSSSQALIVSISISLATLFLVGWYSAKFAKVRMLKQALTMVIMGAAAIGVGVLVGRIVDAL